MVTKDQLKRLRREFDLLKKTEEFHLFVCGKMLRYDCLCPDCGVEMLQPACWYTYPEFSFKQQRTVDHIIPLSGGGSNDWENFDVVCQSCNSKRRWQNV